MIQRCVKGFTLLELMIVMAIVAILAAIALPIYSNYVLRTKIQLAQTDVTALATNVESVRQRTLSYPATGSSVATRGWHQASSPDNFVIAYAATANGYTISADATAAMGKAASCHMTLDQDNHRALSGDCVGLRAEDWR